MSKDKSYYDRIAEEYINSNYRKYIDISGLDFEDIYEKSSQGDFSATVCLMLAHHHQMVKMNDVRDAFLSYLKENKDDDPLKIVIPSFLLWIHVDINPCRKESSEIIVKYANQGVALAMSQLAFLHYYGHEVEQSKELAAYWAKKADEKGEGLAKEVLFPTAFQAAKNFGYILRLWLFRK